MVIVTSPAAVVTVPSGRLPSGHDTAGRASDDETLDRTEPYHLSGKNISNIILLYYALYNSQETYLVMADRFTNALSLVLPSWHGTRPRGGM